MPPASAAPRYPVTSVVILAAAGASVAWWTGADVTPFLTDVRTWYGEPWRAAASALPHLDAFHLAFNVYWFWYFGTLAENTLGRWATTGLILVLAAGSAAAEFAVSPGGVGLSGVVYGLFGLFWVLGRRDERLAAAVDRRMAALFAGWFVLCFLATRAGAWQVANAAHAAGLAFGAAVGSGGPRASAGPPARCPGCPGEIRAR